MAEGTTMCDRKESGIRTAWKKPDQIGSYFVTEWKPLLAVTVSGLIYNIVDSMLTLEFFSPSAFFVAYKS